MSSKLHETTSVIAGLIYNFTVVKMKRPNKTNGTKKRLVYWLNYWHILVIGTSGFTSNTLFIP